MIVHSEMDLPETIFAHFVITYLNIIEMMHVV